MSDILDQSHICFHKVLGEGHMGQPEMAASLFCTFVIGDLGA